MLFSPVELGVDRSMVRYIAGVHDLSYDEVLDTIQDILNETLNLTIQDLEAWIKEKVPMDTGALRDDILSNLHMSKVTGSLLRLILGSSLDYAVFVNAFSTSQVRHGIDPGAIGNFFQEMIFYAKERVQINLEKAKMMHLGIGKFSTRVRKVLA